VSPEGIITDPEKLTVIGEWPTPKNKREIRNFLGPCTYYRRVIFGFASIAQPLTNLTEEKKVFQWALEMEAAFEPLKEALCPSPILAYWEPRERFIFDTEASNVQIGRVLSRVQDGQERVIAC
jgi:hypothetical protein